jgi:hypothetical protein
VQASLDYERRLQQLCFPEGVALNGTQFNRTAPTALRFKYDASGERFGEPPRHRTENQQTKRLFLEADPPELFISCSLTRNPTRSSPVVAGV